jgi:hypothetical protein
MKNFHIIGATVLASILAFSGAAVAGVKVKGDVEVVTSQYGNSASGAIGSARNSKDSKQNIGCRLSGYETALYPYGWCSATDATGKAAACVFSNRPDFERVLATISDDSYLKFHWDNQAKCTIISVTNQSMYEPRK